MRSLEQDMIAWEVHEETKDWQQQQFRAWRRDPKLRLQYPDFYTYLQGRRRYEVEKQQKSAALGSPVVNTSRTAHRKYLTTVKEVPMNTSKPISEEQREAMDQIERWKTNSPLAEGAAPQTEIQALARNHPAWGEWLAASDPLRAACDYDFTRFVSVKEMGMLPQLEASVGRDIAKQLHRTVIERERRELAGSIEDAKKDERWKAIAERAKRSGNYPGLMA